MVIPEGKEKGLKKSMFKAIMAENFPNLGRELDIQIQEAQKTPNRLNPNRIIPGHTISKLSKVKGKQRILKATREKNT